MTVEHFAQLQFFLTIKKSRRTKHERNKSISRKNIKGKGIIEEKKQQQKHIEKRQRHRHKTKERMKKQQHKIKEKRLKKKQMK